jgi:hypothetical protein
MQLLLLPTRFELHSLKPLRWLPLQRLRLLLLPVQPLSRLLWFRCSLLLWSRRLRQLLLQPLQCLRLPHLRARFH